MSPLPCLKFIFIFVFGDFFSGTFYSPPRVFSPDFHSSGCLAHLCAPVLGRGAAHGRHSINVCWIENIVDPGFCQGVYLLQLIPSPFNLLLLIYVVWEFVKPVLLEVYVTWVNRLWMVAKGLSYGIKMHGLCDSAFSGSETILHRIMESRIFLLEKT